MKISFKNTFLWGGAGAAEQMEGHGNTPKALTVWDKLYENEPNLFYKNIGPSITNDFTNKYKEDIKMFKEMNINSIRLGFSWARLFPDGKNPDLKSVTYYHDLLKELNESKIKPIMTLFHFDMPLWAQEKGGFESKEIIDKYAEYAKFVFKEFGDEVAMYATMNEPIVPIIAGYMGGAHYPRINNSKRAVQFGFGTILAHAKAVNIFKKEFKYLKAQIGVVINVAPAYPKDNINFSEEDKQAANDFNVLHNFSMLDTMIKGTFPNRLVEILKNKNLMPTYDKSELEIIKNTNIDFIGMNFYAPSRVQKPSNPQSDHLFTSIVDEYKWDKARINVFRGWEIYPQAIYDAAKLIKERYNNIPFYISENGMGVQNEYLYRDKKTGIINDDYRIAFIQEHLEQIFKVNSEGANCFGYHLWAITDNWSWANAYKNTYGFIEVDVKTQKRSFKKSAFWFRDVIKDNGFDSNYKKIEETINLKTAHFEESINGYVDKEKDEV